MHLVGTLPVGGGSYGTIENVIVRGVTYAAKRTSTLTTDKEALARELAVYNRVHAHPHPHIMPFKLYGVCRPQ